MHDTCAWLQSCVYGCSMPWELPYERGGDACREMLNYTPKQDQSERGPTFFDPLKNFRFIYINQVNKTNQKYIIFYISLCATLKEIPLLSSRSSAGLEAYNGGRREVKKTFSSLFLNLPLPPK